MYKTLIGYSSCVKTNLLLVALVICAFSFQNNPLEKNDVPSDKPASIISPVEDQQISSAQTLLLSKKIDQLIAVAINEKKMAGAVVLVAEDDKQLLHKAYGYAQLFETNGVKLKHPELMTTKHLFDMASLTKVLATTFGIMLLKDQGLIDLDVPVKTYLPSFSTIKKDQVTIRHLLTHTAGLFEWKPLYYHGATSKESLKYISRLPLAYPVGVERHYSDLGFMLLGYLVETVSERTLDQFIKQELYEPLGLKRTTYLPPPNHPLVATSFGNPFEKRMVADPNFGFRCTEDPDKFTGWRNHVLKGEVNDGNAHHAHQGIAGHAGLFSTADEISILIKLLHNKGSINGQQIIQAETINEFLTPEKFGNGLGWAMSTDVLPVKNLPPGGFGHTGFTGTFVLGIPSSKVTIILLTNRQHYGVDESDRYPSINQLRQALTGCVIEGLNL